jgi:hypothetical protein
MEAENYGDSIREVAEKVARTMSEYEGGNSPEARHERAVNALRERVKAEGRQSINWAEISVEASAGERPRFIAPDSYPNQSKWTIVVPSDGRTHPSHILEATELYAEILKLHGYADVDGRSRAGAGVVGVYGTGVCERRIQRRGDNSYRGVSAG